jgi:hypothetical protein
MSKITVQKAHGDWTNYKLCEKRMEKNDNVLDDKQKEIV